MKHLDIIKIEWIDSVSDGRAWLDEDDFVFGEHDKAMLYTSIGFFVRKTKVAIYICQSIRKIKECGGSNLGHLLAIPRKAILSIETFKI